MGQSIQEWTKQNFWKTAFEKFEGKCSALHCVKSVHIRSYSGPYFPTFGLTVRMRENAGQNNSEYGHFLSSVRLMKYLK